MDLSYSDFKQDISKARKSLILIHSIFAEAPPTNLWRSGSIFISTKISLILGCVLLSTLSYILAFIQKEKKRQYEQQIREIEHSSFCPLVFSLTGGLAPAATAFYKRLASQLSDKWKQSYHRGVSICQKVWVYNRLAQVPYLFFPPEIMHNVHSRSKIICTQF